MVFTEETSIGNGIYSPVPTFFKANYDLDLETQAKHAKGLYDNGINGVVIAGSMGESIHLTRQERVLVLKAIRAAIPDKNFKCISGMPYTNMADTISEIEEISQAGADYAILLTPGYYGPNLTHQQGIIDYFTLVADKLALPIIIYHYPGVSNGTDIVAETFDVLAKHPKIIGVKLTHFSIEKYILLTGKTEQNEANNFKPFTGLGQILVPSLAVGAFGAIDGMSGIFPKTMKKLFKLYNEQKFEEANKLQYMVTKANQMIFDLNLVGVKYTLHLIHGLGEESASARPPLTNKITPEIYSKYEGDIRALAKYEASL